MSELAISDSDSLVAMRGITKRFGNITVLENVNFDLRAGEVHVLAGENGAGKSTLIKILAGVYPQFDGDIHINGQLVRPRSPVHANELGVAVIYQELSLIGSMSVADNIFLGRQKSHGGFVDERRQQLAARDCLARLGLDIDPREPVERFSIGTQQCIEIAKALSQHARAIVMDEPTSALNGPEVERLFALIDQLKREGCGIVYISHKMEEIERIADRITVLRDGKLIGTTPAAELPPPLLIQWMVGREIGEQFPRHTPRFGAIRLEARNFSVFPGGRSAGAKVSAASLTVRAGEIVGIGGLQGAGASELLLGMFGAFGRRTSGELLVDGRQLSISSPQRAIEAGLALLTNDRKKTGLVLPLSILANIVLAGLKNLSLRGWRRTAAERQVASEMTATLRIRAASVEMPVSALSGGNQQKVAIAKWLQIKPRVLMLDEPTRGIDIGAKREIYELLNRLTESGVAILLITSEMPELLALCDRIIVMHRGKITAEINRGEATPENVLAAAMGQQRSLAG